LSLRSEKKFSLELGTGDVSEQFDVQDLSPQVAHARGMALVSVDHAFLSGYQIVLETAEGY